MEVAVFVQLEAVAEPPFGHFEGDVFDGFEFTLDFFVFFVEVGEGGEYGQGFVVAAFEDEPETLC